MSERTSDGLMDPAAVPNPPRRSEHEYASEAFLTNGRRVLVQVFPVPTSIGTFIVEVGSLYSPIEAVLRGLMMTFALGMPLLVAVAIGGGYLLTRRAMRNVDEITVQAERISSNNLSERLPVFQTGDELERLTIALNRMMERLDDAFQHQPFFGRCLSRVADAAHDHPGELEASSSARTLHAGTARSW